MYLKILEKSKIELLHRIEEKSFMMGREIMGLVDLNMMEDGRKLQTEFSNTRNEKTTLEFYKLVQIKVFC